MLKLPAYPFRHEWHLEDGIAVMGGAFLHGEWHTGAALAAQFREVTEEAAFRRLLEQLNGQFSVILDREGHRAAAVDRVRSFPILYTISEGDFNLVAPNDAFDRRELDEEACTVFRKAWCVTGNATLLKNVEQLLAGQYLWTSDQELTPRYYAYHFEAEKQLRSKAEWHTAARTMLEGCAKRLIRRLAGRTALIPLSGGYDSRLILSLLKQHHYPDIVAYTYGRTDSHEARIAFKVAETLQVPWHFIPYDRELFRHFFTSEWQEYSSRNHFFSGLPHEQDFFALLHLKSSGRLPGEFVALPGFCGDILGGSITAVPPLSARPEYLEKYIQRLHFGDEPLMAAIDPMPAGDGETAFFDAYQHWYVTNKESKFIVNAVRVFEHFGGDWALPLWDLNFQRFWYSVPYDLRKHQQLYNDVLFEQLFRPLQIAFEKPQGDSNYPPLWKSKLRQLVPAKCLWWWKRQMARALQADVNQLDVLNEMIAGGIEVPPKAPSPEVNDTHAIYFLQNLNK